MLRLRGMGTAFNPARAGNNQELKKISGVMADVQ